jgi:hypothetical protein
VPNSTPATVAVTWPGQREIDPVEHLSGARSERVVVGRRGDSAQRVVPACGQRGATSSPDNALERTRWRPSWASATAGTPVTSASNGTLGADVPGDSCRGYASRVGGSPPGRGATVRAEEARAARSRGPGEPKANRGEFREAGAQGVGRARDGGRTSPMHLEPLLPRLGVIERFASPRPWLVWDRPCSDPGAFCQSAGLMSMARLT